MWQSRIVYYRDFAYNTPRLRMANGSIGDVPAATFAELLSGPMIDIYVGEAKRHWALHRNLLCHHSELLELELEGDGQTTKRKETLQLPDHDPAGFELLVKWLYQGRLDDVSDMADANQKYDYAVSCHKLYLLCDRLDMPQLKNVAMDQYRKGLHQAELVPDADEIDDIYRSSPPGSPFRKLMTRVAARQIMDPASERDVETYRQCFDNNPDFAVDLVKAIRHGTGGMLFEDPTELGNPCEYHDHEHGPSCHVKGKGRVKNGARKTPALRRDPPSAKSTPSTSSGPQSHPPLPPPTKTPRQPPHRQARPQDRTSAGPLRRRLTSPAISTVGTSPETATASPPPNLDASKDREKWRKVAPPERKKPSPEHNQTAPETTTQSRRVQEEPLPSSEDTSLPPTERSTATIDEEYIAEQEEVASALQKTPTRRGIWEWARAGTGRLSIIGRMPHPEWRGPPSAGHVSANGGTNGDATSEAHDDFSIPSTIATEPDNGHRQRAQAAANMEGLGIANAHTMSPHFAQTKRSSDELVSTASSAGSPESRTNGDGQWSHHAQGSTPSAASKDSPPSTPDTPTPQQRASNTTAHANGVHGVSGVQESPTPQRLTRSSTGNGVASPADTSEISSDADATDSPNNRQKNPAETPKSNMFAKTRKASKQRSASNHVPKYRIALAPNVLSSLNGTAST